MAYILILVVSWSGTGTGMTNAEFNSKAACEKAIQDFKEVWGSWKYYAVCVEKGKSQ